MSYFHRTPQIQEPSPQWSSTTKLIVGLTIVAVIALLLVQLRAWIAPLILSFIIAYLFYPIAAWLSRAIRLPWSLSVGLIYLFMVLVILGLLTWGGIAIVDPIQSLIRFIQRTLNQLPEYLDQLSNLEFTFGPFTLDASRFEINGVIDQIANSIRPVVSEIGSLLGSFATGAASVVGRVLFLLLISFFILSETKGEPDKVIDVQVPGYQQDLNKLGRELSRIWNAFLRGQLILIAITFAVYTILLGVLGMRFVIALAILAGLARFVPYVGPWITWITYFLVAILQESTIFGLESWVYAIIVLGLALLVDTTIDNVLTPRIYSSTLRVHPAAVLVAILVSAAWLGLIGIVLAAPVLATLKLFWNYIFQKMLDRDPWDIIESHESAKSSMPTLTDLKRFSWKAWEKINSVFTKQSKENNDKNEESSE